VDADRALRIFRGNKWISTSARTRVRYSYRIATITEAEIWQAIETKHSVWVLSHWFDLSRVDDMQSHVPATVFREWFCGKVPCVAAAGWQPRL
jgi:hypothetical protein